jgi:hypothetical protein
MIMRLEALPLLYDTCILILKAVMLTACLLTWRSACIEVYDVRWGVEGWRVKVNMVLRVMHGEVGVMVSLLMDESRGEVFDGDDL